MLSILVMGIADRLRGSGWLKYSHPLGLLCMGIVTAFILGAHGWQAAYVVAAVMLGMAQQLPGALWSATLGGPMRGRFAVWQRGILLESVPLAVLVRGLIAGAPLLPVSVGAAAAFALGFLIAPYAVRWLLPPFPKIDRWEVMEFTRGAAIAALLHLMA